MYYEERVIDGILHSRSLPYAAFEPLGQRQLTALILREREEHKAALRQVHNNARSDIHDAVAEERWREHQGEDYGSY